VVQVQDILGDKRVCVKIRDEEFIDPLTHTLTYLHVLAWGRSGMAGHNHPNVRQSLI
jgi:hypothetical protein